MLKIFQSQQDPDGKTENSGKKHGKIRIPNFCYSFCYVFFYFSHFFMVAYLLSPNRCNWQIAKVKNYNLYVTEVLDSTFKKSFPGIFNFTVGILSRIYFLFQLLHSMLFGRNSNFHRNIISRYFDVHIRLLHKRNEMDFFPFKGS